MEEGNVTHCAPESARAVRYREMIISGRTGTGDRAIRICCCAITILGAQREGTQSLFGRLLRAAVVVPMCLVRMRKAQRGGVVAR
jgi:hypothetical protein